MLCDIQAKRHCCLTNNFSNSWKEAAGLVLVLVLTLVTTIVLVPILTAFAPI